MGIAQPLPITAAVYPKNQSPEWMMLLFNCVTDELRWQSVP